MKINEMNENCEEVAEILKTLAHKQRLMLLCHLSGGEKTVGELHELCDLSSSYTSQFLKRMKREGLVTSTKEGNFTFYKLIDPKVAKLIKSLHSIFRK